MAQPTPPVGTSNIGIDAAGVVWRNEPGGMVEIGGGGGAPSGATMGPTQRFNDGQTLPAGWWAVVGVGSPSASTITDTNSWDGFAGTMFGLGMFHSDGSIVIDASHLATGGGIWARPVTFT